MEQTVQNGYEPLTCGNDLPGVGNEPEGDSLNLKETVGDGF